MLVVYVAKLGDAEIATHNSLLEFFVFLSAIMYALVDATAIRIG